MGAPEPPENRDHYSHLVWFSDLQSSATLAQNLWHSQRLGEGP